MSSETKWLTRQEVAELTGYTTKTLSNWHHLRKGPRCFKVNGGRYRYRADEVRAWQVKHQQATAA
ncbi:helix-turn-helix transcriptional regulator [Nocardia xishanensis]|uniref:helix-turn-helix transcriptional regulator n=1 Tax=Nocardia xishanensis TaxID=238964 RepID=UPI000836CCA2|nr:helix-turn-helix domain-containing protein [Nocardia xishanensis]